MVDDSVSGATQLPVPTPDEVPAPAPEPTDTLPVPPLAESAPIAAEAVSAPGPANSDLTGQLQALTESLDAPEDPEAEAEPDSSQPGVVEPPATAIDAPDAIASESEASAPTEPEDTGSAETATTDAVPDATAVLAVSGAASVAETLDSIAPGTVAAGESVSAETVAVEPPVTTVSIWPFVGYVVVWLAAAGYTVWQFTQIPAGTALFETEFYRTSMLGGLVLLAAGPALFLIVWIVSWIGVKNARGGAMFFSALIKGAVATLLGALIWWGALLLMDYLRLGRLL